MSTGIQAEHTPSGELWSTAELSAYLKLPVSTLYFWRLAGKGPRSLKVGKQIRYRATEVEAWLEELERGAPP